MSGILVLWFLALLVAYPARNHLRRVILSLGRACDDALEFVADHLGRAHARARRSERRRVQRDPARGLRAHVRFWLGATALVVTGLCGVLFIAPFADRVTAVVLFSFTAAAGAILSIDLGLLRRPARLARLRPRAQRALTAASSALFVGVAVSRAFMIHEAGIGPTLTALLLPLPAAGLLLSTATLIEGARVVVPRTRTHLLFAAWFVVAAVRAPVRPLTVAADALFRAFVAPATAVLRRPRARPRKAELASLLETTTERA